MASSDVNSAHAPQGQTGGDIEMGDVNNTNETPMATPSSPQEHEQVEEPHSLQAQATQPSPQVPAADETQSEPPQTHAPQGQDGGDIETGHANNANETPIATPPILQAHEIQVEESSSLPPQAPATQSSPQSEPTRRELFREDRDRSVRLYKAALNGDWKTAEGSLGENRRETLRANITKAKETVLHVAAGARQTKFVEKLVALMEPEDLELKDENGNNAFCLAAAAGAKSIAEIMIKKNPKLPTVRGSEGVTPLHLAASFEQDDMVKFLHLQTEGILGREDRTRLFFTYIDVGWFDSALELLRNDREAEELAPAVSRNGSRGTALQTLSRHDREAEELPLAVSLNGSRGTALHMLARMPSAFSSKSPGIWKTLINSCLTSKHKRKLNQTYHALELVTRLWENVLELEPDDSKVLGFIKECPASASPHPVPALLFEAAKLGNFKFLVELVRLYPSLIWELDNNGQTIFHIAVLHRHVSIFNQIHTLGSIKDIIATSEVDLDRHERRSENNNILHLAAKLPCPSRLNVVSGAALQMQRELIWFQEVEKIMQPSSREKKNSEGFTPRELFTEEHKDLLKDGEKWMMDRAHFFMLIATIITTVVFAAAFSVPGGNNDSKGTPNHLEENWFHVFTVSEAIAFSCSLFSTMIFLSILTSRYTEKAFLKLLPYKLMAGLLTLFISMIAMMAAFTAAFVVTYNHKKRWAPILTSAMAFLPTAIFVCLQYTLFSDVFKSTVLSSSPFHAGKPMIC